MGETRGGKMGYKDTALKSDTPLPLGGGAGGGVISPEGPGMGSLAWGLRSPLPLGGGAGGGVISPEGPGVGSYHREGRGGSLAFSITLVHFSQGLPISGQ